jgi:aldehyde:ferredoxin oxidoreductase
MCLNDNLESIIMANEICNLYGLDTISTGATIAFAMECYENGIITQKDTGGIELTWGNHKAMVEMTEKMGRREGFGDLLADGVKVAAERIGKGAERYAIHIPALPRSINLTQHLVAICRGVALILRCMHQIILSFPILA